MNDQLLIGLFLQLIKLAPNRNLAFQNIKYQISLFATSDIKQASFGNPWKVVSFVESPRRKWECLDGELGVLNSAVSGSGAVIVSQRG